LLPHLRVAAAPWPVSVSASVVVLDFVVGRRFFRAVAAALQSDETQRRVGQRRVRLHVRRRVSFFLPHRRHRGQRQRPRAAGRMGSGVARLKSGFGRGVGERARGHFVLLRCGRRV
jgi:hypothetical protein